RWRTPSGGCAAFLNGSSGLRLVRRAREANRTATSSQKFGCLATGLRLAANRWMLLVLFKRHAPEHHHLLPMARTIRLRRLRRARSHRFSTRFTGTILAYVHFPTRV